ncbi:MAG: discoidin domain-containing protein [Planctomycetota bacterium]|jgi:hypothetical protein
MRRRLVDWLCIALVFGLTCDASALVVDNFREWNQRTDLANIGGLEITSTGHARFTARVDHDATDVIIHPGGILETLDTYKLPDGRPQPELSNAYVYGTWNARDIQSFGVERAAYIYVGPKGEINIASNTNSGASYNPQAWLDEAQLGGRSLLLAPELDPAVWSIQIEDLGGGAYRITAVGPPPGGASVPSPEDGATDVARDVVLSWTPGPFAPALNGHRLYLSDNFTDVNDGVGGVTLTESSYSPEQRLELGATYYWKVDEVNGAPDFTVYRGDVWSFETEPVGLPISNVAATASSTAPNQGPPSTIVDGSGLTDGLHSTDTQAMWSSAFGGPEPTWIQFELDSVYPLHEMWVWNSNTGLESSIGYGFKDVTIEYSLDGVEYATLGTTHEFAQAPGADGYAHNTAIDFGGMQAKYVRLTVNTNWALFPFPQFGLSEVRFLHIPMRARKPQPDPGTTDVAVDVTVTWRAGRQAAEHEVYVSTDEQAVIDGTAPVVTVAEAGLSPALDLAGTYYWRVDEVNGVETPATWEGNIWNFSTQESLVVDDFESYNDIESGGPGSNLVYETWIDGFGVATNGSTMGYTVAFEPTMETDRVHGGIQSAPMEYDNTTAAFSEVERALDAQNWTNHGIQGLSLWFFGDPANTPGQLYVKINGVRVNYDGAVGNVALPSWQVWNIDLASVATNLQSITSLAVGVDGAGAKGLLLLDDIGLYRVAPEPPNEWRVRASSDDGEEHVLDGAMAALDSSDLELGYEGNMAPAGLQTVGCRWAGIPVPQGATITEAWVQFSADDVDNSRHTPDVSVIIEGQLSPSPATFAETAGDISGRPVTAASVVWDIPRWTTVHAQGPDERTPDISSIIQEIVNQPGWTGEAIVLTFRDNPAKPSQGTREAESFDGNADQAPLLHVSYE